MEELAGKVAVVTGAAAGSVGRWPTSFVAEGMKVVLADIEQGAARQRRRRARRRPAPTSIGVRTDVSSYEAVEALRDATLEAFGAVHVVCNNAGVGRGGTLWDARPRGLGLGARRRPLGRHPRRAGVHAAARRAGRGAHREHRLDGRHLSPRVHGAVQRGQARRGRRCRRRCSASCQMLESPVGVSVLCPGWVKTQIHKSDRNRPEPVGSGSTHEAEAESPEAAELRRSCRTPSRGSSPAASSPPRWPRWCATRSWPRPSTSSPTPSGCAIAKERMEHLVAGTDPVVGLLPGPAPAWRGWCQTPCVPSGRALPDHLPDVRATRPGALCRLPGHAAAGPVAGRAHRARWRAARCWPTTGRGATWSPRSSTATRGSVLPWLAAGMAALTVAAGDEVDVVTWAPTTAQRRRERGFDQAELLARRRGAASSGARRWRCSGAHPGHTRRVCGWPSARPAPASGPGVPRATGAARRHVLLVDDVVTSGATLTRASASCRRGGGGRGRPGGGTHRATVAQP